MRKSLEECFPKDVEALSQQYLKDLQRIMERMDKVPLYELTVGDLRFILSFLDKTVPDGPDLDVLEQLLIDFESLEKEDTERYV